MLKAKYIEPLGAVLEPLPVADMIQQLSELDSANMPQKEYNERAIGIMLKAVGQHLKDAGAPLIRLMSIYYGITEDEAVEKDTIAFLKEFFSEAGVTDFLSSAADSATGK